MTKAELVTELSIKTGFDKKTINIIVENFMKAVKANVANGENVYLRGFGSFITKTRAAKVARNISKSVSIAVPAHKIPSFKPAKEFAQEVRKA
jgi:DNA-binding protein HU-beta